MRGYIREYRPGKFSYTVDVGKVNGKRKKTEKGGFASRSDAERALSLKLAELATTGEIFIPSDKTLEELFNDFLTASTITRKQSTLRKHEMVFRVQIMPELGHRFIKTIKPQDIDNFIAGRLKAGYNPTYVKSIGKTLFATLDYGVNNGLLKENVMRKSIKIKDPKTKVEIFTDGEISTILQVLGNTNGIVPIMIALYTGMRKGEVLALRWSDISFSKNTIKITKQLVYADGGSAIDFPKSDHSVRTIKMPGHLRDYLTKVKEEQKQRKELACEYWQTNTLYNYITGRTETVSDFVSVKENGVVLNRDAFKYAGRLLKKHDIDFHFHKLRHTHATQLLENGATIKMVQERLGHSSPQVTLETYSHVTPLHERDILDTIPVFRPAESSDKIS